MLLLLLACSPDPASGCLPWDQVTQPQGTQPLSGAVKVVQDADRVYTGVYAIGDLEKGFADLGEVGGVSPALAFTFHDWATRSRWGSPSLRTLQSPMEEEELTVIEFAELAREQGTVMAVSWAIQDYFVLRPGHWAGRDARHVRTQAVLDGELDDYIREVAGQVQDFGDPIMISLFGEFEPTIAGSYGANGHTSMHKARHYCSEYGDPELPDGPERIRDLTRYVIDLFREEQVDNVTWFSYTSTGYMNLELLSEGELERAEFSHPAYTYAGDDYIDWVGNSAYFTDQDLRREVGDLGQALDAGQAAWAQVTDKPFFIPEFGASGDGERSRAAVLEQTFESLPQRGIAGFAMSQSELFERYYSLPRLGNHADEDAVWVQVSGSEDYSNVVQTQTLP